MDQSNIELNQPSRERELSFIDALDVFSYTCEFKLKQRHISNRLQQIIQQSLKKILGINGQMNQLPFTKFIRLMNCQIQKLSAKYSSQDKRSVTAACYDFLLAEALGFLSFMLQNVSVQKRLQNLIKALQRLTISVKSKKSHKQMRLKLKVSQSMSQQQKNVDNVNPQFTTTNQQVCLANYLLRYSRKNVKILPCLESARFYLVDSGQLLGTGSFGNVFKAESVQLEDNRLIRECCVVKQLKKSIEEYKKEGFYISQDREYQILYKVRKILKGKYHEGGQYIIELKQALTDRNKRYLVYEHCAHSHLKDCMKSDRQKLTKTHIINIIYQLVVVLKLIHYDMIGQDNEMFRYFCLENESDIQLQKDRKIYDQQTNMDRKVKGLIHRDLKSKNIMISKLSCNLIEIKIIDWAFSKITLTEEAVCIIKCGTQNYQAPQVKQKEGYNCKADVWSIGVIIYQLLTGSSFVTNNCENFSSQKSRERIEEMKFMDESYTKEEKDVLRQILLNCLQYDVQRRWSSLQLYRYLQKICEGKKVFMFFEWKQYETLNCLRNVVCQYWVHHSNLKQISKGRNAILGKVVQQTYECVMNIFMSLVRVNVCNRIIVKQQHRRLVEELDKLGRNFPSNSYDGSKVSQLRNYLRKQFKSYKFINQVYQILSYLEIQFKAVSSQIHSQSDRQNYT